MFDRFIKLRTVQAGFFHRLTKTFVLVFNGDAVGVFVNNRRDAATCQEGGKGEPPNTISPSLRLYELLESEAATVSFSQV